MTATFVALYSSARHRIRNRRIASGATPAAALAEAVRRNPHVPATAFKVKRDFGFTPWRHGGWYTNVRHPSGACGCVSRNYDDGKWRIVCDPRPFDERPTFKNRDDAAQAEADLIETHPELYRRPGIPA